MHLVRLNVRAKNGIDAGLIPHPGELDFAICSAVSQMQNMSAMDAAYAKAVVAGVVNTQPEARTRLAAFADKSAPRVRTNS